MEMVHQDAENAAIAVLGAERYRSLFELGSMVTTDDVVEAAIADMDELPRF
jgi:hypothetical protein